MLILVFKAYICYYIYLYIICRKSLIISEGYLLIRNTSCYYLL